MAGASSDTLQSSTLSVPSAWKIPPAARNFYQLVCWCRCLLKTCVAARSRSCTLSDWERHPTYQCLVHCSLTAIRFKNETENWPKGYRRPVHTLSPKGLSFYTFCTSNIVLDCLPQGIVPTIESPPAILSVWVGKDTTLCFTCISKAEPQGRNWLLNGPSALCAWNLGWRRKPPYPSVSVPHVWCLFQRIVPVSSELTWTLAESPGTWRWDPTWPSTKNISGFLWQLGFHRGVESDLTSYENKQHISSRARNTAGAVLGSLFQHSHCQFCSEHQKCRGCVNMSN